MSRTNFTGLHRTGARMKVNLNNTTVRQSGAQSASTVQESDESILVRASSNVVVTTTDTKTAASIQAALQLAIVLVLSIGTRRSSQAQEAAQELMQRVSTVQKNHQKIVIENSATVTVTTTDTETVLNVQALLQVLLEVVTRLGL